MTPWIAKQHKREAGYRPLDCPCVREEKPRCRMGSRCWHFGNHGGTCDHCHCTGYRRTRDAGARNV